MFSMQVYSRYNQLLLKRKLSVHIKFRWVIILLEAVLQGIYVELKTYRLIPKCVFCITVIHLWMFYVAILWVDIWLSRSVELNISPGYKTHRVAGIVYSNINNSTESISVKRKYYMETTTLTMSSVTWVLSLFEFVRLPGGGVDVGLMEIMGRLRETASFHRRLKNTEFISKKIPFPNKRPPVNNPQIRKIKDPCLVEIRNKHTKELVDIEVCNALLLIHICLCVKTAHVKIMEECLMSFR